LKIYVGNTLLCRERHIAHELGFGRAYFGDKHKVILVAEHHFIKTHFRFGDKVLRILDSRL
jgi:hypothetical protein